MLLLSFAGVAPSSAGADTLPAPICQLTGDTVGAQSCGDSYAESYVIVGSSLPPGGLRGGQSSARDIYYYEVVGAQSAQPIVANVLAYDSASAGAGSGENDTASAIAATTIYGASGAFYSYASENSYPGTSTNPGATVCEANGVTGVCGNYYQTASLSVIPNTIYEIILATETSAQSNDSSSATAFAYADPSITVQTQGYSVIVSPGASNEITPVPLPATAWLLLFGIGGVGAVARKHKEV